VIKQIGESATNLHVGQSNGTGVASAPAGRNINAATSGRLTDQGGGPVFYSCLVEVERIGD
jgi:hypothetical protein